MQCGGVHVNAASMSMQGRDYGKLGDDLRFYVEQLVQAMVNFLFGKIQAREPHK